MINSVHVTNLISNESMEFILSEPEHGIAIKSIEGLGEAQANINTREGATFDGSLFNSSKLQQRNIVITFLLYGDDVEESRHLVYKYFATKSLVELTVKTDKRNSSIKGYVETCEPEIFSENETVQVSIVCPDPLFYINDADQQTSFSALDSEFEFPFENDVEYTNTPKICMGDILKFQTKSVYYMGDEDTGVVITCHILSPVTKLGVYDVQTKKSIQLDMEKFNTFTGGGLMVGDDVIFNTNKKSRSATLLRNGKSTNILSCLNKDVEWFQLHQGDNVYTYLTSDDDAFKVLLNIEYQEKFKGV